MRRAARIDENQPEIVAALRRAGAVVTPLHRVGEGCPDLLVSHRQRWLLMECKTRDGELNERQRRFIGEQRAPVYVVTNAVEAVGLLNMVPG